MYLFPKALSYLYTELRRQKCLIRDVNGKAQVFRKCIKINEFNFRYKKSYHGSLKGDIKKKDNGQSGKE